jgi:hypothetical protein
VKFAKVFGPVTQACGLQRWGRAICFLSGWKNPGLTWRLTADQTQNKGNSTAQNDCRQKKIPNSRDADEKDQHTAEGEQGPCDACAAGYLRNVDLWIRGAFTHAAPLIIRISLLSCTAARRLREGCFTGDSSIEPEHVPDSAAFFDTNGLDGFPVSAPGTGPAGITSTRGIQRACRRIHSMVWRIPSS